MGEPCIVIFDTLYPDRVAKVIGPFSSEIDREKYLQQRDSIRNFSLSDLERPFFPKVKNG